MLRFHINSLRIRIRHSTSIQTGTFLNSTSNTKQRVGINAWLVKEFTANSECIDENKQHTKNFVRYRNRPFTDNTK
jgi:hypothetical protein